MARIAEGGNTVKRVGSAVLVALAILVVSSVPASALDLGEWVVGLKLSPFLSQRFEYESNVFQTPDAQKDDVISKTIPGFLIDYSFGAHSLSAGYRAEILRFFELDNQDTVHHIGVFQLRLDFPRLLATLRDDFTHTTDPPNTELIGRIESTTNLLAPAVEYRITSRMSVGVNYGWTNVDFERRVNQLDRDEHLIGATFYWKFVPRADVGLGYSYGEKLFDSATDRDVTRHLVTLGLRGEITPKLSSTFRVGFEERRGVERRDSDFTGLTLGGGFDWRPIEGLTLFIGLDRSVQESVFSDTATYVTTGSTFSAQRQIGRVTVSARLAGGVNDYEGRQTVGDETRSRRDLYWGAGAGLEYDFRPWLRAGLEYLRLGRDSNFESFDFNDDRVSARVTLQF